MQVSCFRKKLKTKINMRKIAATYIFSGNGKPLKNGIVVCENDGTVIEVVDTSGDLREQAGLEFYNGILVPGFVDVHCNLDTFNLNVFFYENGIIEALKKCGGSLENDFLSLCPSLALFFYGLPPLEYFINEEITVCIGSNGTPMNQNHKLAVFDEMLVLQKNYPELALEELIKWACFNGALALKTDNMEGSLEKGKRPGINIITGIDFKNMKLTDNSTAIQLI